MAGRALFRPQAHSAGTPLESKRIDWPHGPRQAAQTCPSLPWTERPEQPSTTLRDSPRETRSAWKNAQYGALLGVTKRLASRATRCDSLQKNSENSKPSP